MRFSKVIIRTPASTFDQGQTTVDLGHPDYHLALAQHESYRQAMLTCGASVQVLAPLEAYPDAHFVEDAAVLTEYCAILTNPGVNSRQGEQHEILRALEPEFETIHHITGDAMLDGGDVIKLDKHYFIGISRRTNPAGAAQLADILQRYGYTTCLVDIRNVTEILHLTTGMSALGDNTVLVCNGLRNRVEFAGRRVLEVPLRSEDYAANCIRMNDHVIFAQGFDQTAEVVQKAGYDLVLTPVSEFAKMDGGLSCLSLRYNPVADQRD